MRMMCGVVMPSGVKSGLVRRHESSTLLSAYFFVVVDTVSGHLVWFYDMTASQLSTFLFSRRV